MREAEVFVLADRTLNDVIQQIKDDQWAMTMPASFATRQTDRVPTLREIVNYHAYDDVWVPLSFYGAGFATVPAYLRDLFGTYQVGAIHGRLLTAWSTAGVLGPVIVNAIADNRIAAGVTARTWSFPTRTVLSLFSAGGSTAGAGGNGSGGLGGNLVPQG